jgi:hypothetical protein
MRLERHAGSSPAAGSIFFYALDAELDRLRCSKPFVGSSNLPERFIFAINRKDPHYVYHRTARRDPLCDRSRHATARVSAPR